MTFHPSIGRLSSMLCSAAGLLLLTLPALASDIDDCRSKAAVTNEVRLKACSAVINDKAASTADQAYAFYKRAMVASGNPNAEEAEVMKDVSRAIALDPKLMEAYAFRALSYNKAMQYDKAIADLTSAIEIAPDRWGLYSLRAMIYVQKKDTKEGLADFRKALTLNPPATSAEMIKQRVTKLEQAAQ